MEIFISLLTFEKHWNSVLASLLHYVISDNCKLIAALDQMSLFVLCYNNKIMLFCVALQSTNISQIP